MSDPSADPLRALIGEARDSLDDLRAHTDDRAALIEGFCDQLDNIATAAEFAGMAALQRDAEQQSALLHNPGPDEVSRLGQTLDAVAGWVGDLYLSLQSAAPVGAAAVAATEPGIGNGESGASGALLRALAEELRDEFDALQDSARERPDTITSSQLALVQRCRAACATLDVPGLGRAFTVLENNLIRLLDESLAEQQQALLASWPMRVLAYLQQSHAGTAADLVELLEDAAWPQPLQEQAARELLVALADVTERDEEAEPPRLTSVANQHVSLQLSEDLTAELLDAFFQESPAQAAELSERVKQLSAGVDLEENLRAAQRLAHTLKGAGNLIGVSGVANIAHYLEDLLELLPNHNETVSAVLADVIQDAADCLEAMIEALLGQAEPPADAVRVLQNVIDAQLSVPARRASERDAPEACSDLANAAYETDTTDRQATRYMRVADATVDEMFRMAGEVTIGMGQIQERIQRLLREGGAIRNQDLVLQKARLELENQVSVRGIAATQRQLNGSGQDGFDSLEMDRYDALYGSAHAFIESAVDLREMSMDLQRQLHELDALFGNQQRLNGELQDVILGTRMVPVKSISGRLQRTVRQTARSLERLVELTVSGDELLLDNDILRAIADPLMHVLRNAVDHGIESPQERERLGKPAAGQLQLRFRQEGNYVVAEVADDGRGIDYAALRETGVARGVLDAQDTGDPAELRRLMLIPGFSTRSSVTQISGRGVGMDVVHATVTALNGSVDIQDNPAHGCSVQLRLPVTLIANHCLLVQVAGERLAVPSHALERILAPGVGELTTPGEALRYKLGKDVYPARHLHNLLHDREPAAPLAALAVMLVNIDQEIIAVSVDRLLASGELVVKNLGKYVKSVPGVAGVSVLGDGSVVPVLDLAALLRRPVAEIARAPSAPIDAAPRARSVLIVDDSLSVRRALAGLLEDAGYDAHTARDGLEAIKVLEEHPPDMVLADLEMPRLNGLELTQFLRADARLGEVPIIMITSRGTGKHRRGAEAAGVDVYMNKPVSDEELLACIDRLLGKRRIDASAA